MAAPDRPASRQERPRVPIAHFPAIDGLRFVASFGVLVHHVWNASDAVDDEVVGGLISHFEVLVAVFFLVSAFLLYLPWVVAHFEDRPLPASGPFLKRRMLRIIPAFWVALVVIGLIEQRAVLFSSPKDYVLYFGFLWIYSPDHLIAPITQAWTVASEVVWYLILPILGVAVCRVRGSLRRKLRVQLVPIALFALASFVFVVLTRDAGEDRLMYSQWILTYMDCVAIGMLFAVIIAWQRMPGGPRLSVLDDRRLPAACWILAFGGYGAMVAFTGLPIDRFTYSPTQYVWQHLCTVVFASLLLFPLVFGPLREGRLRGFLASRPMAWLGLVSYGIYLWHIYWIGRYADWFDLTPGELSMPPAIVFVLAASVVTAAASYYLVERPVQRWGNRHR